MKSFFENLFGKKQEPQIDEDRCAASQRKELHHKADELFKKGDMIGGKYEVLGTLGKGGFGVVFLVRKRGISKPFALKTFRDELLADPAARAAFKKEALLWVNLESHPFILEAMWVDEVFGRLFVAMEQIIPDAQGRVTLADHLAQTSVSLETNQVLKWAIQYCSGMEHATDHGLKCHRDIKPANILITEDGTLKISDFGLAAAAEVAWRGLNGRSGSLVCGDAEGGFGFSLMQAEGKVRCGTPGYIAPEVYRYERADTRSDIYSFGLVLWQMAAGSPVPPFMVPWRGDLESFLRAIYEQQISGRVPRIKSSVVSVIDRCLRPKPSERYGSFQELRVDLELIWKGRTGKNFEIPEIGEELASFWNNKGTSLNALRQHEEAIRCFDRALAIDPREAATWSNKGIALDCLCRYDEAINCYDKALAIDPQNASIWINRGVPLNALGQYEEAIRSYDKALAIDPRKSNAWGGKGSSLRLLGRHEESIECYDQALAIDARNAHYLNNKGNALREFGKHKEAINCFNKALMIDPRYADAWFNKALTEDDLKLAREAVTSYQNFVEVAPPQHAQAITHARQRLRELES